MPGGSACQEAQPRCQEAQPRCQEAQPRQLLLYVFVFDTAKLVVSATPISMVSERKGIV